ncbi:MAG: YVTN family beta-propeller protein [Planctomycetota bacterium]|jgi:YVTN family beta-propeller protein
MPLLSTKPLVETVPADGATRCGRAPLKKTQVDFDFAYEAGDELKVRDPARDLMLNLLFITTILLSDPGLGPASETLLVASTRSNTVTLLDAEEGEHQLTLRLGGGPGEMAISPDGSVAVVAIPGDEVAGDSIGVIDLAHQSLMRTIKLEGPSPGLGEGTQVFWRPRGVAFLPDGDTVLVVSETAGALLVISLERAEIIASTSTGGTLPQRVVLSPDGRFAFVSNQGSGTIGVINLSRRRLEKTIDVGGGPSAMALTPDEQQLWVANRESNSISLIQLESQSVLVEFPCGSQPSALTFTSDGAHALCTNMSSGNISIFDVSTHKPVGEIELPRVSAAVAEQRPGPKGARVGRSCLPTSLIIAPGSKRGWVAMKRLDAVAELNLSDWSVIRTFPVGAEPSKLVWSRKPSTQVQAK